MKRVLGTALAVLALPIPASRAAVTARTSPAYVDPLLRVLPYRGGVSGSELFSVWMGPDSPLDLSLHFPSGVLPVLELNKTLSLPQSLILPSPKAAVREEAKDAEGGAPAVFEQLSRAPGLETENLSEESGRFWDARGAVSETGPAPPWFPQVRPAHAANLQKALALAWRTKTGSEVLREAGEALGGQRLPIDVLDLGRNLGEYDYLDHRLRLNKNLLADGRTEDLAATLVHELRHVVQHKSGLPAYVLELELEAHLGDLEFLRELGREPQDGTFAKQALDFLREGPERFAYLISLAVPGSPYLGESSLADIRAQLEEDLEYARGKRSERYAKLAERIEQDLERLKSRAGAKAYRDFSRRVRALAKRRAAAEKRRMTAFSPVFPDRGEARRMRYWSAGVLWPSRGLIAQCSTPGERDFKPYSAAATGQPRGRPARRAAALAL